MADLESKLLPFPHRPRPSASPSFSTTAVYARQPVLAQAELRIDIVKDLLHQICGPEGLYPQDIRLKMTLYAAEALLDETVVLYRRALSSIPAN